MRRRSPFAEPRFAPALALIAALAALTATGWPAAARAGSPPTEAEITRARERFAEARRLEEAGSWADALTALQRVAEVRTTPQVRFHIALCMEHVGMWTQALDGYAQAADEAGAGAPEVVQEAHEHLRRLARTIPTVSLRVEGAAAGDELLLDRRRVPLDDTPLPLRADPGPHTAELRRGGAVVARELFALDAGTTRRIELHPGAAVPDDDRPRPLPPLPDRTDAPNTTPGAPGLAGSGAPSAGPGPAEPDPGRLQRALGAATASVGGTAIVLTGVFAALRVGTLNRLLASCPTLTGCSPSVAPIVSEGKTYAALSNVLGVVGGVGAAAGFALLITTPARPPRAPAPAVRAARTPATAAWIELRADGLLALRGAF